MVRHILVPTDGSPAATRAARLAIDLAKPVRARITALHVTAPLMPSYAEGLIGYPDLYSPEAYTKATRARASRTLARVTRACAAAKVRADTAIVEDARPWKAILATARARGCDLIVMGSGKDRLEAFLVGSVAAKVLAHSKKPVLVCR
jgi:nucleotide-binding universal stress UspA family protein